MADIRKNNESISEVSLGDTINDWRNKTNDEIIAKLNLLKVYDISAGIGLDATGGFADGGTGGTFEMQISDTIAKSITIDGNLTVNGNVSFSDGEVSFPSGIVNVNGDNTPVAGEATGGIVVGSYTGPDWNSGTTHPFLLNYNGYWMTNQDLRLIGGGTLANASIQKIFLGESNGKTLTFRQTSTSLIVGNGHTYDEIVNGTTLSGDIMQIRSSDGRVNIHRGVNKRRVSGVSHDFSFGQVVRASGTDATGFTLAVASGGATLAEAVGMISRVNGNSEFDVTFHGEVEGTFSGVIDGGGTLSTGCPFFLSPLAKGKITGTEPFTDGHVSKPVLIGLSSDRGLFVNYRGQEVNTYASAGSGGGTADSIRVTLSGTSFNIGELVSVSDTGTYEKLSDSNKSKMFGLVVNDVSGGQEVLLYGASRASDGFSVSSHIPQSNGQELFFADAVAGIMTGRNLTGTISPTAVRRGTSDTIFFFNTRFGSSYTTSSLDALTTTGRSDIAYTSSIVAGGSSGGSVGGGGYVASSVGGGGGQGNVIINGGFDIWQRGIGVGSAHTGTGDTFFADRWARVSQFTGTTGSFDFSIQRQSFANGQRTVLGTPRYYTDVKAGFTASATGKTYGDYLAYENRIEDANSYAGQPMALSFYLHGTSGATGFCAVEYKQYWNGTESGTISTQKLGLVYVDGTDDWTRHAFFVSPKTLPSGATTDPDTSFAAVSILPYRYNGLTGSTGAADVQYNETISITKVQLELGTTVTDPLQVDLNEEYNRAKRYYQTSYTIDEYNGANTLIGTTPKNGSPDIVMSLGGNVRYRFPIEMRTSPTSVTLYSPSGVQKMMFNLSAGRDLNRTAGTVGYNSQTRSVSGLSNLSGSSNSPYGMNIYIPSGFVPLDRLTFHYAADAEFNAGVND